MNLADSGKTAGRKAQEAGQKAGQAGQEAANSKWLRRLARIGFAAKGLLYLLIAFLALQIAFGGGSEEEADNSGALQIVAQNPAGEIVLWVSAAGLLGLAVWQFSIAVLGGRWGMKKTSKRVEAAVRTVIYGVLCVTIVNFLLGSDPEGQDSQSQEISSMLMELPGGRFIVGAIGLGLIITGAVFVWRAIQREFEKDLALGGVTPQVRKAVVVLGVVGNTTKGVVVAAAGGLFTWSAITFDPDEAEGLDGTLRTIAEAPAGPWILALVALGLALYGAFCFCKARWAIM